MNKNSQLEKSIGRNKETITLALSILAIILSTLSLWQGCENMGYVRKQFEISQLPNWFLERTYSENSIDLISVKMKSHLPEITVKRMLVFPPSDFSSNETIEVIGDTWKTYEFLTTLNKTIASYFEIPESNSFPKPTWLTKYPFAVKIEYWQNNQTKYSTCLFLLHLKLFNQKKIKIYNIEPIEFIENLSQEEIVKKVDVLNNSLGIHADIMLAGRYPSIYENTYNVLDLSEQVEAHKIEVLDNFLNFERLDTAYFPTFTYKKEKGDSLIQILQLLNNNLKIFPEDIRASITKLSSFIDTHPLKSETEDIHNFIINSTWRSKETFYEWFKIVWELKGKLCAELSKKYKLFECDTSALNKSYRNYLKTINITL